MSDAEKEPMHGDGSEEIAPAHGSRSSESGFWINRGPVYLDERGIWQWDGDGWTLISAEGPK